MVSERSRHLYQAAAGGALLLGGLLLLGSGWMPLWFGSTITVVGASLLLWGRASS